MTDIGIRLEDHDFLPTYANEDDAGMDCRANIDTELLILPGQCELVPLGFRLEIPSGHMGGFLFPKSGRGHKEGLILGNCIGVIDAGYQGEVMASIWNRNNNEVVRIKPRQKICQLLFLPIIRAQFYDKDRVDQDLAKSARGEGGFGSTGIE